MNRPLATADELACPKCRKFGCDCEPTPKSPLQEVCPVCRRNMVVCICKSHVPFTEPRETAAAGDKPPAPRTASDVVNEAMVHYYARDAAALQRLVRGLAERK